MLTNRSRMKFTTLFYGLVLAGALSLLIMPAAMAAVCVVPGVADPTVGLGLGFCSDKDAGAEEISTGASYIDVVIDPQTGDGSDYSPATYTTWDVYISWDSGLGSLTAAQPTTAPWPTTPAAEPTPGPTSGNITVWCDPPAMEENAFGPLCNVVDTTHATYTNGSVGFSPNADNAYVAMRLLINPAATGSATITVGANTNIFGDAGNLAPPRGTLALTISTPPCHTAPAPSGLMVNTVPVDENTSNATIAWTKLADDTTPGCPTTYAVKKCEGASCSPSTAVSGTASCVGTTCTLPDTALTNLSTYGYNVTGSYGGVPGTASTTVFATPVAGAYPMIASITSSQVTITQPLVNTDFTVEGTANDADAPTQNLADLTVTPYVCVGDPCVTVVALTPVHPNSSGVFSFTIDGDYVIEDTPGRWAIRVTDDFDMCGGYPATIFTSSNPANCADADLMTAADWTWTSGNINYYEPTVGSQLEFRAPPTMSEYPFDPTDGNGAAIQFATNAPATVTMRIYTMKGRLIRILDNKNTNVDRDNEGCYYSDGCYWNGTDYQSRGTRNYVPSGMYIVNIHADCTDACPGTWAVRSIDITKGIVVIK